MKRFNPSSGTLEEKPRNGFDNLVEEFYDRIGHRFPLEWKQENGIAVPEIESEKLPEEVSESDVKTVLNNMKNDGWF